MKLLIKTIGIVLDIFLLMIVLFWHFSSPIGFAVWAIAWYILTFSLLIHTIVKYSRTEVKDDEKLD